MKPGTWRKQHKWSGIILSSFLLMLCLSGIVLNHRTLVADVNISRGLLPPWYHFNNWNNGLLRGTLPLDSDSVLIYGAAGLFIANGDSVADFNEGLPAGADRRAIRSVVRTSDGQLFALSQFNLFSRTPKAKAWTEIPLPRAPEDERLSDLCLHGDSLLVVARTNLYLTTLPQPAHWTCLPVATPDGYNPRSSLFKTLWRLHSGEIFGLPGKLIADALALIFLFLLVSGLILWAGRHPRLMRWHNKIGRSTILLTFLIVLTGWCLRPPLMVPLVLTHTKPLNRESPWHDKLRALRYDEQIGDWILHTSDGFFSLSHLQARPVALTAAPPVSVMGINVWERNDQGDWLVGSFSGMCIWERSEGCAYDYTTGLLLYPSQRGAPFGQVAVSGYTPHFPHGPHLVTYGGGTDGLPQPASLSQLPMSLWNVALEVHTGRIYFGNAATFFWIFLIGLLTCWCLWSGWKMRRH